MPEDLMMDDAGTPEELEQLWTLGMYNPLAHMEVPRDPGFEVETWLRQAAFLRFLKLCSYSGRNQLA